MPTSGQVRAHRPGLDPSWSTTERRGEALLGPVAAPPGSSATAGAAAGR